MTDPLAKTREPARPLGRVWLVANPASGSTEANAVDLVREALGTVGGEVVGTCLFPEECAPDAANLRERHVDSLVIIGGDGTINAAVHAADDWPGQCLILPGGTMNMLAKRLHGDAAREVILAGLATASLVRLPVVEAVGHRALVAVIFGPATAWVHAREGLRHGKLGRVWRAARLALARSLGQGIRVAGTPGRHRAVVVSPLADGLDVVIVDAAGAGALLKLGWSWLIGDWRAASGVATVAVKELGLLDRRRVRALFDGEPIMLPSPVKVVHGLSRLQFVSIL